MGHSNDTHVAKELQKPDLSTAEAVVKQGLFMKTSDNQACQQKKKPHKPALIASRTHCAVYPMSHHKGNGLQMSHMCFYCRSDYTAEPRHRLKTRITELRLGRRLCPVLMQLLQEHSNVIQPQSTLPGAGLTYRGLIGLQQGSRLCFNACLRKGGGARSAAPFLLSRSSGIHTGTHPDVSITRISNHEIHNCVRYKLNEINREN